MIRLIGVVIVGALSINPATAQFLHTSLTHNVCCQKQTDPAPAIWVQRDLFRQIGKNPHFGQLGQSPCDPSPAIRISPDGAYLSATITEYLNAEVHLEHPIKSGSEWTAGTASNELSSQRTALSFDRTALASDRTLMAMVRTSLALIGFGFTIFQFFHKLSDISLPSESPRRFGLALIILGVLMLIFGISNHLHDTRSRRARRAALFNQGLIHHPETAPPNTTVMVAVLLLGVGILAILRVALSAGPL